MQVASVNANNRWGFTFKPFFDGTDLAIHNANLSKAGRTFFDFILTKLDGKRRNLMTIPFSDTEFAQRFNYSESRARHARLEVVDAKLAEQHFGRTKNGHRIVGKFCFKLVVPNAIQDSPSSPITPDSPSTSPAQQTQQIPPSEPPVEATEPQVTAKVADSQPEKWLGVSHKSGQGLATFSPPESYSKPVIARFTNDETPVAIDVGIDVCINVPPPISPSNIEMLSLAWNESHEYEQGEEEAFDKYFDKAIRATMAQYSVDEPQAVLALERAFHKTPRNKHGDHPCDYPTAYTGDPDYEDSKPTPRGRKLLKSAVHAVQSGQSFTPKPPSSSDHPTNDSTSNNIEPATQDSNNSSASTDDHQDTDKCVQTPSDVIVSSDEGSATQTPTHTPTQAEIDAELLAAWDDDRWLDWVDEHVAKVVRVRQMLCESPLGEDISPYTDAEIETMRDELLAKYPETDEQRLEWIRNRISERECERTDVPSETAVEAVCEGATTAEPLGQRIAKTIKSSLMADREYSDEQIIMIVQRQERSIDSAAILEVWYNWSDWSAYLNGVVNQRIHNGVLMPDEVREARSYAARLKDWERKNEQWEAVG